MVTKYQRTIGIYLVHGLSAAIEDGSLDISASGKLASFVADLDGQLSCGCDDHSLRSLRR